MREKQRQINTQWIKYTRRFYFVAGPQPTPKSHSAMREHGHEIKALNQIVRKSLNWEIIHSHTLIRCVAARWVKSSPQTPASEPVMDFSSRLACATIDEIRKFLTTSSEFLGIVFIYFHIIFSYVLFRIRKSIKNNNKNPETHRNWFLRASWYVLQLAR